MPQGICKSCDRLIYDTEKVEELPDQIECQHCHYVNTIKYPCKMCPAIFLKPVHLATHVRSEHREIVAIKKEKAEQRRKEKKPKEQRKK